MKIPTIEDIKDLRGKRVVLRLDFNVPMKNGKIMETIRIDRALPTVEYLRKKQARIIILSHLGSDGSESLKPIARYIAKALDINIGFVPDFRSPNARSIVEGLALGGVVLFENLRLDPGELKNDPKFSKYLASFGDMYVNDAFAVSHRAHASVVGITKYLPSYIGLLIVDEIKNLSLALKPKHPFLFILGGAKFETKMPLLKKFCKIADLTFIGGILANDFFKQKGLEVGMSVVDKSNVKLLPLLKSGRVLLPTDVVVKSGNKTKKSESKPVNKILSTESVVDVGPGTIKNLIPILKRAKLVVWNGPLGFYEGGFDKGTIALLNAIAKTKATSIVGGGDTAVIVEKLGIAKKLTFVSTGGGATLDFLADGSLPGIEAVKNCKKR
jgi:3-phosphoglycerate kinase